MVFKNDLVVVVKCNGKVLRERDNIVYLPFGSEYSLLVKNLRNVKASVSISIDGEDVLNGHSLIVGGNSSSEVERFIKGSLDSGNRFKFIEKTDKISEFRGDRVDDGIVRVSYRFEEEVQVRPPFINTLYRSSGTGTFTSQSTSFSNDTMTRGIPVSSDVQMDSFDDGITVGGSVSDQKFVEGHIGTLESTVHVLSLQLKGKDPNTETEVTKPLTVKAKLECQTCGTSNSGINKFCAECGTGLVVI